GRCAPRGFRGDRHRRRLSRHRHPGFARASMGADAPSRRPAFHGCGCAVLTPMPRSSATVQFRVRITKGDDIAIGPGKVDLLEAIAETGSITAAAKRLGMSYRRAWMLVDTMN